MIKIQKSAIKPLVLQNEQTTWTSELLSDIKKYGSYKKLPDSIKNLIADRYKHPDIKSNLVPNEDTKCAFCESIPSESGYIEIEHFLPKSIYHKETYEWTNLLPSCKRCNLKKLALDTQKQPIIKPDIDDPEQYFSYDSIKLVVKKDAPDKIKARRTIKKLDLNQHRLIRPRSDLLVNLIDYETELEKILEELQKAKNSNKINRLKSNIFESLDKLESLVNDKSKYSGFCRDFMKKSQIINLGKSEVNL